MQKDMEAKAEKETTQQLAVARGTQAFRNFTERTNNNYIEKILEQYKQHWYIIFKTQFIRTYKNLWNLDGTEKRKSGTK